VSDGALDQIDDLYREVVLEHARERSNRRQIADATHTGEGWNHLCGDEIRLSLRIVDDVVTDVAVGGRGCAISQASSSMMADLIRGRSLAEVQRSGEAFRRMISGDGVADDATLGDAIALRAVRKYPRRVGCATLAWTTLAQTLSSTPEDGEPAR